MGLERLRGELALALEELRRRIAARLVAQGMDEARALELADMLLRRREAPRT